MTLPHPGDVFPELTVQLTDGRSFVVPEELSGGFGVVLFFRGAWCPYCNTPLRAFQHKSAALADVGARVVAPSTDTGRDVAGLIEEHDLTSPVGYGADARHLAQLTGAVVDDDPLYGQSTGFVLDLDGAGDRERLLQRGHRPAGSRRRGRADALSPRERGAGHHVSHVATVVAFDVDERRRRPECDRRTVRASRGGSLDSPTATVRRADSDGGAG